MYGRITKASNCDGKQRTSSAVNEQLSATECARLVRQIVSEVVERECGIAPRRAQPGSFPRRVYAAGMVEIRRDFRARRLLPVTASDVSDFRAAVTVAANRCCWRELRGRDGERARFRSQIRCILALTPGYAIWRGPVACRNQCAQSVAWIGGRIQWRTERRAVAHIGNNRGKGNPIARMPEGFGFDAVRAVVLQTVNQTGTPVAIEALVVALDKRLAKSRAKAG